MKAPTIRYRAFGLAVESEIALPGLPEQERQSSPPDIDIQLGPVPNAVASPFHISPGVQIGQSELILDAHNVARFHIRAGREIRIAPAPGASERNIRTFLLGSALGAVFHQRGLLPLHASAVAISGACVAFAGASGAGKSTAAAYFHQRGLRLLCDDVCVVDVDTDGASRVWPGPDRVKLWRDSATHFGHDVAEMERAADGVDKFYLPLAASQPRPLRLARLYVLTDAASHGPSAITPLRGGEALDAVLMHTYRRSLLTLMGRSRSEFDRAVALLQHSEVFLVRRRRGFDVFAEQMAEIEDHARGVGLAINAGGRAAAPA